MGWTAGQGVRTASAARHGCARVAGGEWRDRAPGQAGRHYETISRVCPLPSPGHPECNRLIARSATASTANASYLVRAAYPVGPAGGLTPGDLATAYGVTGVTGTDGAGQTVGIIDFGGDSKLPNDLNSFDSYYGLAPCTTASGCFTIVGNDGTAAGVPPDDPDAAAESSMDVDHDHRCRRLQRHARL